MENSDSKWRQLSSPAAKGCTLPAVGIVIIACVCGWFMMQLEILGMRILVPHFGSGIYVTGSVIGVFLLSLSIGYMFGGWLCGKINAWVLLGAVMVLVGLWKSAIPVMTDPVCNLIYNTDMDVKWGSLLASLILYCFPTVLLGTVSPTVMHWLAIQTGNSGFSAGLVLATSTMASFAGCLAASFYLVLYSLKATLYISGIIIGALGAVVLLPTLMRTAAGRRAKQKESSHEKPCL